MPNHKSFVHNLIEFMPLSFFLASTACIGMVATFVLDEVFQPEKELPIYEKLLKALDEDWEVLGLYLVEMLVFGWLPEVERDGNGVDWAAAFPTRHHLEVIFTNTLFLAFLFTYVFAALDTMFGVVG